MYYEKESGVNSFLAGILVGAVLGAGVALLAAPQSGKSTRTKLIRRVRPGRHDGSSHGTADDDMDRAAIMARLKRRRRKARR